MEYNDSTIIDIKDFPKTRSSRSMVQKKWYSGIKLITGISRLPNALYWIIKKRGSIKSIASGIAYIDILASLLDSVLIFYNFKSGYIKYKNRFGKRLGLERLIEKKENVYDEIKIKNKVFSGNTVSCRINNTLLISKINSKRTNSKRTNSKRTNSKRTNSKWCYFTFSKKRLITHSKIISALNNATKEKLYNQYNEYKLNDEETRNIKKKINSSLSINQSFNQLFTCLLENSLSIISASVCAYFWWQLIIFEEEICNNWGAPESLMCLSAVSDTITILKEGFDMMSDFVFRSKERFFAPQKKEIKKITESDKLLWNDITIN